MLIHQVFDFRYLFRVLNKSYIHTVARFEFVAVLFSGYLFVSEISNQLIFFANEVLIETHTLDWILERSTVEVDCHLSVVTG